MRELLFDKSAANDWSLDWHSDSTIAVMETGGFHAESLFLTMARQHMSIGSAVTGWARNAQKDGSPRSSKVKFGNVIIRGVKPGAKAVKMNIERSTTALERVTKKLIKPGVVLRAKKNVPQYAVAEGETGVFIRRLNGRVDRGRMINGTFQVID